MIGKREWDRALSRLRAVRPGADKRRGQMLARYVRTVPSAGNAIDIFKGEWSSRLPPPLDGLGDGVSPLFEDNRLAWAIDAIGGVSGRRILELGPLEAGHTYMLDRAGAQSVLSIEANTRAYLKCLVIKELLGLPSARFLCGDFMEYLRGTPERVDLALASGVLYHQMAPVELMGRLAGITDALYMWTHYYDEGLLRARFGRAGRFADHVESSYDGYGHVLHRFTYDHTLEYREFCGGTNPEARWMTRDGILGALAHFGFSRLHPHFKEPNHPHGPAFAVLALR